MEAAPRLCRPFLFFKSPPAKNQNWGAARREGGTRGTPRVAGFRVATRSERTAWVKATAHAERAKSALLLEIGSRKGYDYTARIKTPAYNAGVLYLQMAESPNPRYRYPMEAEGQKTVLMLDDERFLLDIYRMSFEKHGFSVRTFRNVDDALSALRGGFNPDVMLFDITMPDSRSGYEFIESVKREGLAPQSLSIALTNAGQDGAIERIMELGADAHLLKADYLPAQIVSTVEMMLAEKPKS